MQSMDVLGQPARRLGSWLIGFGVVGLVLAVIFVIGWLGSLAALGNLDLDADRGSLSTSLSQAADLMDSTATALESSTETIGAVSDTLADTTVLLNDLADTTTNLADALDVSIFGQQPFGSAAASLADIADELDTFAQHASTLDEQVTALQPDLTAVVEDLRTMQASTVAMADRAESFAGGQGLVGFVRAYAVLSALMAAWLGVLAAICVWAGRQLRLAAPVPPAASTPTS
jgi:methyl-accepting chemotaxis protein